MVFDIKDLMYVSSSIPVTTPVLPDENSKEEVEEGSGASVKSPVEEPDSVER